jgi:putative tryptophan/tyrosine transport system substrate-binding protein
MRRREFIAFLGGAATWPLVARAQQPMPVIGFLGSQSLDYYADLFRAIRQGLKDSGYADGEDVPIVSRSAENQIDRLPALAAELVQRRVAVIVTEAPGAALAAKAATATIPIVFAVVDDPVRIGLVTSMARPDGNLTGVNFLNAELAAKRLEILRELVPSVHRIAVLINPNGASSADQDLDAAARTMGLQIIVLNATTSREIDAAFASFARDRPDALFSSPDPFFRSRRVQMALLAARTGMPTAFALRDYAEAGGLMSYGASLADAYRKVGVAVGRVLRGAKPADVPVEQSTKFELVINNQTARMLGLTVPPSLLARADEVIE